MVQSLWQAEAAAELQPGLAELVYRSSLLGADRRVCNWGGGNTSMKMTINDFRNRNVEIMSVKGNGSDLATMGAGHFTALRMDDVGPLFEREQMSDKRWSPVWPTACWTASIRARRSRRCCMPFCLFCTWIRPIRMRSSAYAVQITVRRLPGRYSEIASSGCRPSGLSIVENDRRSSAKPSAGGACPDGKARAGHLGQYGCGMLRENNPRRYRTPSAGDECRAHRRLLDRRAEARRIPL